jgi:hypothetical protein
MICEREAAGHADARMRRGAIKLTASKSGIGALNMEAVRELENPR